MKHCHEGTFLTLGGTVIQANNRSSPEGWVCGKWQRQRRHILSQPHWGFGIIDIPNTSQRSISSIRVSSDHTARGFCCDRKWCGCLNCANPENDANLISEGMNESIKCHMSYNVYEQVFLTGTVSLAFFFLSFFPPPLIIARQNFPPLRISLLQHHELDVGSY